MTPNRREFLRAAIAVAAAATIPRQLMAASPMAAPIVYQEWTYVEAELVNVTTLSDAWERWAPSGILRFELSCGHSTRVSVKVGEYERIPCYECSWMAESHERAS